MLSVNNPLKENLKIFYLLTGGFALLAALAIIKGFLFVTALPLVLLIALLAVFRMDTLLYLTVIATPLSLNLAETPLGIGISIPSEPLMFGLFILFWLKIFSDGGLSREIVRHPVSIMIFIHLAWFLITTVTSTMPVVSIKSFMARLCYISLYYFMLLYLFKTYKTIIKFLWLYMVPLVIVIAYTIINHIAGGLTEDAAHIAMVPFYNDHTAYAAVISFFIPPLISLVSDKDQKAGIKVVRFIVLLILATAIVLSYTRAAWVGLIAALGGYFIFLFRMKTALVYTGGIMLVVLYFLFETQITLSLEQNNQVSGDDLTAHAQSIGNISTDDSNVERLNRWACAIRMFLDKPVTGFGPGTYMFQYAPYQKFSERSGISTNWAEGGGSHSEYLGPMAEQGLLGMVTFVLIGIAVIQRASSFIKRCKDHHIKNFARGLLLGLVTYWVHGFLNYFLDTEKASVPFWGFVAAIVALDLYHDKSMSSGNRPATQERNIIE